MNKVSIIGLGFVGLPLAGILSNLKKPRYQVNGIDKSFDLKKTSKRKFLEKFKEKLTDRKLKKIISNLQKNNNFTISNDFENLKNSKVVVVSINFDFKTNSIRNSYLALKNLFEKISLNINKSTLIFLETTIPPGTSEKIIIPTIKKTLRRRGVKNINYAYSYERVMPGKNYFNSIVNINRCYAGINRLSEKKCENFLKSFINTNKFPLYKLNKVSECEVSKILENSYRALNIAFIDEWTKYSNNIGINLNKIIDGIKIRATHQNMMRPGLGVGGYCLTKDPEFAKISSNYIFRLKENFPLTSSSIKINKRMPYSSINFIKKNLPNKNKRYRILILGAAYKQDIGDYRLSPSIDLYKILKKKNIVHIYDPFFCNDLNIKFLKKIPKFVKFDVIIFCINHQKFKKIKLSKFSKKPYYFDLNCVLSQKLKSVLKDKKYKLIVLGDD